MTSLEFLVYFSWIGVPRNNSNIIVYFNNSIFNDIEVIFTSNYVRTIETAKYISENNNIKINILDELRERRLGISSWSEKPKDFERRQFSDEKYKIGDG